MTVTAFPGARSCASRFAPAELDSAFTDKVVILAYAKEP
jgi:hypothetical protein